MPVETIKWVGGVGGHADLIDQTVLPGEYRRVAVDDVPAMYDAIQRLVVRGAPAIGIAGAYGVILGLKQVADEAPVAEALEQVKQTCAYLTTSRPTAVNLGWALERMRKTAESCGAGNGAQLKQRLLAEAEAIRSEDAAMCRAIGANGAYLVRDGAGVLTHCNAGGLATADFGTALAVMYVAHEQGKRFRVYADETRPLLQGARLTAWELMQAGIDVTVICDNMAGYLMSQGKVDLVIVGADRIAANGDTANKIGTYSLAVLAQVHQVPFYVAAPASTFDLSLGDGGAIPIEQRAAEEITSCTGRQIVPEGAKVYNPAFDVTPHRYISAIITDRGVIKAPTEDTVRAHFTGAAPVGYDAVR